MARANRTSPELVGLYSVDEEYKWKPDVSQLKYLTADLPEDGRVNFDLKVDDITQVKNTDSHKLWLTFVDYLAKHKSLLTENAGSHVDNAAIVTTSRTIKIISTLPVARKDMDFEATFFRGIIYFWVARRDYVIKDGHTGHKFKKFLMSDSPQTKPTPDLLPLNEMESFFCVYKMNINDHKIIYKAKVDCVLSSNTDVCDNDNIEDFSKFDNESDFINKLQRRTLVRVKTVFEGFRPMRWERIVFLDNFLCNSSEVYMGVKDAKDRIKKISRMKTRDLEKNAHLWSKDKCIANISTFFDNLKETIKDQLKKKYTDNNMDILPPLRMIITKRSQINALFTFEPTEFHFKNLPDDYINEIKKDT